MSCIYKADHTHRSANEKLSLRFLAADTTAFKNKSRAGYQDLAIADLHATWTWRKISDDMVI